MAPAGIAALSAALLEVVLGEAVMSEVSLGTEARTTSATGSPEANREIEADARATLRVIGAQYGLSAAYFPQLVVAGPTTRFRALHNASLSGSRHLGGMWNLELIGTGSYGTRDLLLPDPLQAGAAPGGGGAGGSGSGTAPLGTPVQPVPPVTTLPYGSASVSAGLGGPVAGRSHLNALATGTIAGGADAEARRYLPLERTASLRLGYGSMATATDTWQATFLGDVTRFSTGTTVSFGQLTGTWRHAFTRDLQVWGGGGPALASARQEGKTTYREMVAGELGLQDAIVDPAISGYLVFREGPFVDLTSAVVHQRADVSASLAWRPTTGWSVSAVGSGGVVLSGVESGNRVGTGEFRVTRGERTWHLGGGLRGTLQTSRTQRRFEQWGAFAEFTVLESMRF